VTAQALTRPPELPPDFQRRPLARLYALILGWTAFPILQLILKAW